jgi:hypothetical protein
VDKELLFKPRLPEADVDVPGVGTVRVRGLNRGEAMMVAEVKGTAAKERKILSLGLVDPPLTDAEVGMWQKASPAGELEPVSNRIAELSGMLDGSAKEAVKQFEADSAAEFRVLPGAEAVDDGGSTPGGDE